jgi:hypothetical protein
MPARRPSKLPEDARDSSIALEEAYLNGVRVNVRRTSGLNYSYRELCGAANTEQEVVSEDQSLHKGAQASCLCQIFPDKSFLIDHKQTTIDVEGLAGDIGTGVRG